MPQPYALNCFANAWRDTLRKPHEAIFAINIGTISDYLLDHLKSHKEIQKISYQQELLKILQNTVNEDGVKTKILRRLIPSTIRALGSGLPAQSKSRSYLKHFKKVYKSYDDPRFVNSARTQMLEILNARESVYELNTCMRCLIRSLLRRYSVKYLEKLPPKFFARSFFELHRCTIHDKITSSGKLQNEQSTLLSHIFNKIYSEPNTFSLKQRQKEYLECLHLANPTWERDLLHIILKAKNTMRDKKIIDEVKQSGNNTSKLGIYKVLNQPHLQKNFLEITEAACFSLIISVIREPLDGHVDNFIREMSELEFCQEFSNLIKSVIYPHNTSPQYESFAYGASFSSYLVFSRLYSEVIHSKISRTKLKKLTARLLEQLSIFFFSELQNTDSDILNKFELNRIITKYARDVCYDIFEDVLVKIQSTTQKHIILQIKKSFIRDLLVHFFEQTDNYFSKIPNLTKKQLCYLITSLCQELQKPPVKTRVNCLLGGLSCDQKHFQIGNVTFYDPRIWDFGEDITFDLSSGAAISISENLRTEYGEPYEIFDGHQRKRNSARAVVDVTAHDYESAINQAEIIVQNSVNSLVFASSAFAKRGFKSQIPVDYALLPNDGKAPMQVMGPRKLDHDFLTIDNEYLEISKFYDQFLQESSTKLNNSLLRALNWYNRGHWSEMAHEKFVFLWVALEQLILRQLPRKAGVKELLKYVPKLIVTWHNVDDNRDLRSWFNEIMKNIEKKSELQKLLDSDSRFEGWRQNYGMVFKNLEAVILPANGDESKCADLILKELTPTRIANIKHGVRINRSLVKFKIALLASKRNSLIHEGLTHSAELDIMSKELEKILSRVIHYLIYFRSKNQLCKIIYENNMPFHVRDRRY